MIPPIGRRGKPLGLVVLVRLTANPQVRVIPHAAACPKQNDPAYAGQAGPLTAGRPEKSLPPIKQGTA
jgi:hypothetical protein